MNRLAMAAVAIAILPGVLAAQTDSSRMRGRDTTRGRTQQSSSGVIGRRSRGNRNSGLTSDQISQLQTALQQANCDPGAVDGIMGPRTRSAMACARQKNNITGNNPNDLYRALNLNFTTSDSTGMGGAMSSHRRGARGRRGSDSTMNNSTMGNDTSMTGRRGRRGMGRTGRDSTMRRGTGRDSTGRTGRTSRPGATPRPDSTRRP